MKLKEAKTIKVGDILMIKGTTGVDEGKLGKVVRINDWGHRIAFELYCLNGLWGYTDGNNKPADKEFRTINNCKVQLYKKRTLKVKVRKLC